MNDKLENLRWLQRELIQDFAKSGEVSLIREFLHDAEDFDRDMLLRSLFLEALHTQNWQLAGKCALEERALITPSVSDISDYGPFWLVYANLGDRPDVVEWLIGHGADIERRGMENYTPLIAAVASGLEQSVQVLLDHGASVNVSTIIDDDNTALMVAALYGNESIVSRLLQGGADVHKKNRWGKDALELAEEKRHFGAATLIRNASKRVEHD